MCVTSLRLPVTPSMVPLGRLLVFYVRENGEGVADNLQFAVENFFENQVGHGEPTGGVAQQQPSRDAGGELQGVCAPSRLSTAATWVPRGYQGRTARAALSSGIIATKLHLYRSSSQSHPDGDCIRNTQGEPSAPRCLHWVPDLRDTIHAPSSGLSFLSLLPASFETGCYMPSASACPHPPLSPCSPPILSTECSSYISLVPVTLPSALILTWAARPGSPLSWLLWQVERDGGGGTS